jgi:SNF family Na+-dependent transporter
MSSNTDSWGSRVGLILAMAGNAVGLGNFLRFPVQAVQNGGGAFIIPYLVSFVLMGIPLLWVEWGIGRYGGRYGDHSTPFILDNMTKKRLWKYFGVFGIFTNMGVMAYYTYIESWTLTYAIKSIKGDFLGMGQDEVAQTFLSYIGSGSDINFTFVAFAAFLVTLSLNIYILSKGLSGGIEKVAKFAMPLLILFGIFLAIRAITLGATGVCPDCDSHLGMDFLWKPQFDSLSNPKVWLAAAGQIFFTLSVGMGTIHCYASYVRSKDDIALNAMSAGWMNGFVEIVLGSSVVIPIAVGYLGLDWVKDNAGFSMAFQTMPYLFDQFGALLGVLSGLAWFGLLFFAGVTSSLAMGTPWMGFMKDEFDWSGKRSAITLGVIIFLLALPTILFYDKGVFDEYDYWTGTVSLVIFALAEVILFSWVFGIDNGWEEITRGSDMKVPKLFKPIIKYVTPLFILVIFLSSLFKPGNGEMADWQMAFGNLFSGESWPWANDSIINQIFHLNSGTIWKDDQGWTDMFFVDMSRFLLLAVFFGLVILVKTASNKRRRLGKVAEMIEE